MKRKLVLLLSLLVLAQPAFADFKEHFDLGTQYLSNYQYSQAISEFKDALRINYKDNSARIQMINAYLARGMHYANDDQNWSKAADDYRSALFYMQIYPDSETAQVTSSVGPVTQNLNTCLNMMKFDRSPKSRYERAKQLRAEGNFPAAAYEFTQSLGDKNNIKDSYIQTADIIKILGNEPKSADFYQKAITVDPTDITVRMQYAKLLDKLGSEDAAVNEYNYIMTHAEDNMDILNTLERIYKRKVEDSPSNADLNANLGAILQKQGKYDEALIYYKNAEQLSPSNVNTRINVGTLYQQKGDYKTALIAYDSVLILEPNNINVLIYKAQCKSALGENKASMDILKKVLTIDPSNAVAQGEIYNSAKASMSVQDFVEYVNKHPYGNDPTAMLYAYAMDLHKQNKLEDAKYLYTYLLPKDTTGEIYLNLSIVETQQNKSLDALNLLYKARDKFPQNKMIAKGIEELNDSIIRDQLNLAAELYKNKEYAKSIEEYKKVIPPSADTLLAIASAYQNLEDNKNAIVYYKKALDFRPDDSDIAYYIAALYADADDWDSAEAYAQKALLINATNKEAATLLAEVKKQNEGKMLEQAINLFDSQKYDQSLPLLNQLLTANQKNAYALYYRAMIYDSQKKYNEAIADYKKAISLKPDEFKIINYMLAVDYDALEKYKEAYDYYIKYSSSDAAEDEYKTFAADRAKELKTYVEQSTTKPVADKK